ncbi:MAG: enoyl-CoA hydratase/isomerase family protein [Bacteroidales bacterium]|nr:enoyl-CoA hydratase/isomerase family protein [Bacteroidales bacterium]
MSYQQLEIERNESVLLIKINRPKALNALNNLFFDEMNDVLSKEASEPDVKVILLIGLGKAFVAGADIAEMVNMDQEEGAAFSKKGQDTFNRIENFPIPIIAAINGFALGGGLELAMSCDFRIASKLAKFGQPEVNLGLIPGYAGTQRLSRLTNMGTALYLLLTAEMIGAEEALQIGLVQKLTEPEALLDEALRLARLIVDKGPNAIRKVKAVTRQGAELSFVDGCKLETNEFASLFGNEGKIGMTAFLNKEKPNWNQNN